jgi:hypothetical protein
MNETYAKTRPIDLSPPLILKSPSGGSKENERNGSAVVRSWWGCLSVSFFYFGTDLLMPFYLAAVELALSREEEDRA